MKLVSAIIYLSLKSYTFFIKTARLSRLRRKIQKLIRISQVKELETEQKNKIIKYYSQFGIKKVNTDWHRFYSGCNHEFSNSYIPEELFYLKIEPDLNKAKFAEALADKNLLHRLFKNTKQPESVIKNINGFYFHDDIMITKKEALELCTDKQLLIKPTIDTGGGKNIMIFHKSKIFGENDESLESIFKEYQQDFIVQKVVVQSSKMKTLNSTSLNTFRVMSFLAGTEVKILSIIVRMGREGAITDNSTTGGLSCGVFRDGTLKPFGYENNTGAIYSETDGGIPFKNILLPFMDEIYKLVEEMHKVIPYFRLISWDLAVDDKDELVFIEYNISGQDINFHQLNNGPVLGELLYETCSS